MASGRSTDLWPGEEKLQAAQARASDARDAPGNQGCSHRRLTGTGPLWTAQHGLYRTGESDCPSWNSRAGSSNLGYGAAVSTSAGQSGVVASVLSFCPSSCIVASGTCAAARTRLQTIGATVPTTDSSHGSRQDTSTMDNSGSALVPLAAAFRLRGSQARGGLSHVMGNG